MRVQELTTVDHIKYILQGAITIVVGMTIMVVAVFMLYFTFNTVKLAITWLSGHWFR